MERQQVAKLTKTSSTSRSNLQAKLAPQKLAPLHPVLQLQRKIGNQAVQRLLSSGGIQAKLSISQPDDPYEREADRVADTVMRMPEPVPQEGTPVQKKPLTVQITSLVQRESEQALEEQEEETAQGKLETKEPIQRQAEDEEEEEEALSGSPAMQHQVEEEDEETLQTKPLASSLSRIPTVSPLSALSSGQAIQRLCAECEDELAQTKPLDTGPIASSEEEVQRKEAPALTPQVTPSVSADIRTLQGGGSPLPSATREFFEPRFGADFSQVRVHTDSRAVDTAKSINAKAFTFGRNIAFGTGRYAPHSHEGRQILAHELTHVVQQNGSQVQRTQPRATGQALQVAASLEPDAERKGGAKTPGKDLSASGVTSDGLARRVLGQGEVLSQRPDGRGYSRQGPLNFLSTVLPHLARRYCPRPSLTIQRQPVSPPGKPPPKRLTRAEEVRLSFTSPGEIAATMNPPMISLYNFAINQPTLKKEHLAALKTIALLIKLFPGAQAGLRVEGHADSTGDDIKINEPLSENRAAAAQKVLEGAQIDVFHCGELCPITTNDTVAGRSRNRRVDIYFLSGKKPDDIDWPSLCSLAPVLCLCLKDPALCREGGGDGDGIHWPCSSLLGALICGLVVCVAASAILRNPMLCLPGLPSLPKLLCLLFPSLCRQKPKPSQTTKEKCCPPKNVNLPNGNLPVHAEWPVLMLQEEFRMLLAFKDDPQEGCACRCCEYQQDVRGFFEIEFANGRVTRDKKSLTPGIDLEENKSHEDGLGSANSEYGHRSHPPRVIHTDDEDFEDAFFPRQASGCYYRGLDKPDFRGGVAPEDEVRWKWFLEFEGGPVDACEVPGKRTPMKQHWHKWRIDAEIKKPMPRTPRKPPIICAGLPPNAKVGDKVSLSVHFEGDPEDCYGNIDVRIIALSSTELTVRTQNPELWNIAPEDEDEDEDCPEMWIHSYQVWTFFGSPPCGYVA